MTGDDFQRQVILAIINYDFRAWLELRLNQTMGVFTQEEEDE